MIGFGTRKSLIIRIWPDITPLDVVHSKEVWASFPRQNEAMNFVKEHGDVRIFSYQDHHNGQRRFLVSTDREFWRRYKNMASKLRHHYEVIQECEEDVFMASLICNMDADCEKLLVCKMDMECVKTLHFGTEVNYNLGRCKFSQGLSLNNTLPSDASKTFSMGKSPYPDLDKFVEAIFLIGTISVMYVVDLRWGVYYQKCSDLDCRGYRSPIRQIPLKMQEFTIRSAPTVIT